MFHTHTHTHKSRIYIQNPLMTPTFLIAWLEIHALWCDGEKSNETLTNKIHTVQSSLYLSSAMQMSRPGHYWPVMTPSVTLVQPIDRWWHRLWPWCSRWGTGATSDEHAARGPEISQRQHAYVTFQPIWLRQEQTIINFQFRLNLVFHAVPVQRERIKKKKKKTKLGRGYGSNIKGK